MIYLSKYFHDFTKFIGFAMTFDILFPQDLITVFDERELELLIGGMSEIDVYVFQYPPLRTFF
jgi:hypothetical protein